MGELLDTQGTRQNHAGIQSDVFLLNPANRNFLDGKRRRWNERTILVNIGHMQKEVNIGWSLLFLIPFIIIGIFEGGNTINSWVRYDAINKNNVASTGKITSKHIINSKYYILFWREGPYYYLNYSYSDDGVTYSAEQSVEKQFYEATEIGTTVSIKRVPSNPQFSMLSNANDPTSLRHQVAVGLNLFIWPLTLGIFLSTLLNWLAAKEGQLVSGEVIAKSYLIEEKNKDLYLNLEYVFNSPITGEQRIGKAKQMRGDLREQPLPAPGTPVAILYRNDKHYRLL